MQQGDVVDLVLRWGTQERLKCPVCHCFIRRVEDVSKPIECTCGSTYQPTGQRFEVVTIRGG